MRKGLLLTALLMLGLSVLALFSYAPDLPVQALKADYAPAPSRFVAVDGLQLHLRDEGPRADPLPLVLLHGTSASLHTWQGWTELLRGQRRVVRFDLPGFGLTGPAPDGDYRIQRYVRTLLALLDELGIERCVLVGNSLGGYVAWAAAVMAPDRVEKLILIDAAGIPFQSASVPLGFRLAQYPSLGWISERFLPRALVAASLRNVYGDPDKISAEQVDRYFDLTRRAGNRQALVQRFQQTRPGELSERLSSLRPPTLILWGAEDRLIPPEVGERQAAFIPDSQLKILPGIGHVPQEEAPELSLEAARAFIGP